MCNWRSITLVMLLLAPALNLHATLDDPTRPPGHRLVLPGGKAAGPSWHVNAIRIGEQQRSAIVNGRRVTLGDRIDGARVIDIQPSHVRLRYKQQDIAVRLVTGNIIKKQRN